MDFSLSLSLSESLAELAWLWPRLDQLQAAERAGGHANAAVPLLRGAPVLIINGPRC